MRLSMSCVGIGIANGFGKRFTDAHAHAQRVVEGE